MRVFGIDAYPTRIRLADAAAAVVVPALIFVVCLGWHPNQRTSQYGLVERGDYDAWQVIAAVLLNGVLVAVLGYRRAIPAVLTPVLVTGAFTLVWSVDAANVETIDANLWPVGAVVLAFLSLIATSVVALLASITKVLARNA